MFMMYWENYWN